MSNSFFTIFCQLFWSNAEWLTSCRFVCKVKFGYAPKLKKLNQRCGGVARWWVLWRGKAVSFEVTFESIKWWWDSDNNNSSCIVLHLWSSSVPLHVIICPFFVWVLGGGWIWITREVHWLFPSILSSDIIMWLNSCNYWSICCCFSVSLWLVLWLLVSLKQGSYRVIKVMPLPYFWLPF